MLDISKARYDWDEWLVTNVGNYKHAIPVDDLYKHQYSVLCKCEPRLEGIIVYIHNSYDEREYKKYETFS